jgi:acetyl esterase/lipase
MDDQLGKVLALPPAPDAIELRHLRAFVAVAEELNFGRAAARLYLSQPALSRQVSGLEKLVGCDLLRRSTHLVELTLAGEALLKHAKALLGAVDEAVSVTRSVGGELESRMARLWAPFTGYASVAADIADIRVVVEEMHSQFPPPEDVTVTPVNAGGVPSLVLTPQGEQPGRVLFLHGGGYVSGSAFGYRHLAGALAAATTTATLVPEYRLAPEHPFPAAIEDALRAYLWTVDGGVDPGQIYIAGDSAGGGLVFSLLLSIKQQGLPMPGAAMLFCPWVDLTGESFPGPDGPDIVITKEQIMRFANAYLGGQPADDPLLNPLNADLSGLPPLLLQAATGDTVLPETRALAERAREHGVDVRLELYPVPTHDFHVFWSFLPEARDALHAAGDLVRELRGRVSRRSAR